MVISAAELLVPKTNEPPLRATLVEARLAPAWKVAPDSTIILGVAKLPELARTSVPPETVVSPEYVLALETVSLPDPVFATVPVPEMALVNVCSEL